MMMMMTMMMRNNRSSYQTYPKDTKSGRTFLSPAPLMKVFYPPLLRLCRTIRRWIAHVQRRAAAQCWNCCIS